MILFETREQYGLQTSHKIVCRGGFRWRYKRLAKIFAILGPAFIAAVAYIDPGNFATNITAGSQYGYLLLWVIAFSNLMAVLIQSLSAKLGIATGKIYLKSLASIFLKTSIFYGYRQNWSSLPLTWRNLSEQH